MELVSKEALQVILGELKKIKDTADAAKETADGAPVASNVYTKSQTYSQTEVNNKINQAIASTFSAAVVTELPATTAAKENVIYLIKHAHTGDTGLNTAGEDSYDEYIYIKADSKFERIGNTDIDLSAYAKTADVNTKLNDYAKTSTLSNYVKTTDSRLTDARKASDVSAWAKAATKPAYTANEITGYVTDVINDSKTNVPPTAAAVLDAMQTIDENRVAENDKKYVAKSDLTYLEAGTSADAASADSAYGMLKTAGIL